MNTSLVSIPSVLELHKQTWEWTNNLWPKMSQKSHCVILVSNHIISYQISVVFLLCLFLLVQDPWCTYIYIRVCVLNSRLAALFLPCGWIFLRANPKSFAFILDMIYSVCCAFLNHKRITKEQKTCIFSKNACFLFGCQKITLVDNLPV
mgnify:CR=1 FL=1